MTVHLRLRFWRAVRRFAVSRVIATSGKEGPVNHWACLLCDFATERLWDAQEETPEFQAVILASLEEPVVRDLTP